MNASSLASALNARRAGDGWMAHCPAHDDKQPSLSISYRDGVVLIHCHAGCAQAEVISALRARGLWSSRAKRHAGQTATKVLIAHEKRQESDRRERALAIWQASSSAEGTLVETYLRSRGIVLPPPSRLRFHPALRHLCGSVFPAMIALVTRGTDDHPIGIHRTFIANNGSGKAPVTPQKMMLGPCRGGAVRLCTGADSVMVGEGIESVLSVTQATDRPGWAALSTSGLRSLHLPVNISQVVVLADGDDAGEAAALACSRRWQREGRIVRIARPPRGWDFNDLLNASCDPRGAA
jgi:hypothetical protein